LFFNNLVICHIDSSVSQLSLFSLSSTISLLWTQFWASVDTTWTPRWTPKSDQRTDKNKSIRWGGIWCPLRPFTDKSFVPCLTLGEPLPSPGTAPLPRGAGFGTRRPALAITSQPIVLDITAKSCPASVSTAKIAGTAALRLLESSYSMKNATRPPRR